MSRSHRLTPRTASCRRGRKRKYPKWYRTSTLASATRTCSNLEAFDRLATCRGVRQWTRGPDPLARYRGPIGARGCSSTRATCGRSGELRRSSGRWIPPGWSGRASRPKERTLGSSLHEPLRPVCYAPGTCCRRPAALRRQRVQARGTARSPSGRRITTALARSWSGRGLPFIPTSKRTYRDGETGRVASPPALWLGP